ncbi:MAG: MFS transporter [Solirubrobacterales bacterium]|nr:MFS transporter [Solirubrobacterales bacterium]MBV9715871.1 MFS transporter [Solirubrobacterales bacterium]
MHTRESETRGRAGQHYHVTFAILALAGVSYALLQSLVAPALPELQRALHTSVNSVSWVLTAYLVSASVATPLVGRLGDMYGKERLLVVVLVLLCVATIVSALATSLAVMLAGRVVQGAAGGVFPLAFGIIRDEFPHERVAGAVGVMSALLGVGGGAGVVLAGPIVANLSYHYLFWLPLIALVPATIAVRRFVPESPVRVPGRVNWTGAALMSTGLAAVLIAVSETSQWHWLSGKTLAVLGIGIGLLAAWMRSEARSEHALVDMRMLRVRGVWTTNAVALLLGFGMYASFILLPDFVETPSSAGYGFGSSVTGAGLFLAPSTLAMLVAGAQTGRLEKRFGSKPPLLAGASLTATSYLLLAVARSERWEIYVAAVLLGAGIGLAFAAMVNLIIENVGPAQTGIATGMNTVARTVGGAFGGAAVASILASTVGADRYPSAHGFTVAFAACALALAAGVLVGLAIPPRRPADAFSAHEAGDLAESAHEAGDLPEVAST